MTSHDDIRAICANLPGATESESGQWGFGVDVKGKRKGLCWSWLERKEPKKARIPNDRVLAIRVPNLSTKDLLLDSDTEKFFTEAHYNGYPAILVRLDAIEPEEIEGLLIEAWRCQASKDAVKEFDVKGKS